MINVSVIIPAERSNENLKRCLKDLKKQTYKGFEVITVLDKFSGSPAEKRNWGAKKAKGEFLAFIDDDCFVEKDWLTNGVKIFSKDVCAVCGPMLTPENSPFWERVSGYLWESPLINPIRANKYVEDWPSANFFIRKRDFEKLGGFDSRFWPGEDTKLCLDIVAKLKKKIVYDSNVVVYHRRRPLFKKYLEQVARYGRQRGRFARLFPETSRKWQYFVPSLFLIYIITALFYNRLLYLMPVYITLLIIEGIRAMVKDKNVLTGVAFILGAFMTHIVYGVSFLRGLLL